MEARVKKGGQVVTKVELTCPTIDKARFQALAYTAFIAALDLLDYTAPPTPS